MSNTTTTPTVVPVAPATEIKTLSAEDLASELKNCGTRFLELLTVAFDKKGDENFRLQMTAALHQAFSSIFGAAAKSVSQPVQQTFAPPQGAVPQGAVPQGAVPQGAVPQGAVAILTEKFTIANLEARAVQLGLTVKKAKKNELIHNILSQLAAKGISVDTFMATAPAAAPVPPQLGVPQFGMPPGVPPQLGVPQLGLPPGVPSQLGVPQLGLPPGVPPQLGVPQMLTLPVGAPQLGAPVLSLPVPQPAAQPAAQPATQPATQ
jgi:hypothetical protein